MTIKEAEKKLGIPRASIRFYEKEGLIAPKREENGYREYSDEDVATLRKVVLFRKLGLSVSDIEDILDGSLVLKDALIDNVAKLEEQISELNGALEMSKTIIKEHPDIAQFDEDYYWEAFRKEEAHGSRFMDIAKDIAGYQKSVFLDYYGLSDSEGKLKVSPGKAVAMVVLASLVWGGARWLIFEKTLHGFLIGAAIPLLTAMVLFFIGLPIHLLAKKYPKVKKYEKFVIVLAIVIVLIFLDLAERLGW